MTRDEILAMPAGPEMDAAVEQFVLAGAVSPTIYPDPEGGKPRHTCARTPAGGYAGADWVLVPKYSTSDAAAWNVLKTFPYYRVENTGPGIFVAAVGLEPWTGLGRFPDPYAHQEFVGAGFTSAIAICRAALLAKATSAPVPVPPEGDAASRS